MSNQPSGPFYKVKLKSSQLGWISSIDIKPGKVDTKAQNKKQKIENDKPLASYTKEQKELQTFALLKYRGVFVQSLDWKEKTLGHTHKGNLLFYGWNWTGYDSLVEGPFYFDTRVMASFQAPEYYKKLTSFAATGWALKAQVSFVSANPMGENFLFHYGMGVSTSFSHFKVSLFESGNRTQYTAEDLNIGVVFPVGFSYRFGSFSTQAFFQYYMEKAQMAGASLGLNWAY